MKFHPLIYLFLFWQGNSQKKENTNQLNRKSDTRVKPSLAKNKFVLNGNTLSEPIKNVYLYKYNCDSLQLIDILKVVGRIFTFKDTINTPQFYTLKTDASKYLFKFLVNNSFINLSITDPIKKSLIYSNSEIQKIHNSYLKKIDSFQDLKNKVIQKYPSYSNAAIKKIKNEQLEILSISEDKGETEWINAIATDNLCWKYHILDKNKSITFRYGVESIPFKLLIDKQGRIASEKIYGNKLDNHIKQLLKE